MMPTDLPYRPNVCLIILNSEKKVFLGERSNSPGIWQFPQGGVEADASEAENALREASEELGVSSEYFNIEKKLNTRNRYDFRQSPAYAVGRWRGQDQSFWILTFSGEDQQIQLDLHDQEFTAFKWVEPHEIEKLADPVRLKGYRSAIKELCEFLGLE